MRDSTNCFDDMKKNFEPLDKKEICNELNFYFDKNVADIDKGYWPVQFLGIFIEKICGNGKEKGNDRS